MRSGARNRVGSRPEGKTSPSRERVIRPWGRGQPRASRTGRQRRARLPSTPRRGGGNAEFGCRDGRRRQGAGAVCTGTPSDCGSRREGFQPSVPLPAIGFRSGVRIASRIPVRAGGTAPSWTQSPQHRGSCFFLALAILGWALGAQMHTARKIKPRAWRWTSVTPHTRGTMCRHGSRAPALPGATLDHLSERKGPRKTFERLLPPWGEGWGEGVRGQGCARAPPRIRRVARSPP